MCQMFWHFTCENCVKLMEIEHAVKQWFALQVQVLYIFLYVQKLYLYTLIRSGTSLEQ